MDKMETSSRINEIQRNQNKQLDKRAWLIPYMGVVSS
jgi:hypothetical protein